MVEELRLPITVVVSITPLPQTAGSTLQVERVTIPPALSTDDPRLHRLALVLQAALGSESVAGQLSAQRLADGLVTPFSRQHEVTRQFPDKVTGGLSPCKLRRTIAYIESHLAQELSLATLAAVGAMSPAHFARLFKQATGLSR